MAVVEIPNIGSYDVQVWRDGDGPPLLYLHGYERHPGGASFLTRLARSHHVLAPEHPGYGTSTGFEHVHDVLDLVLYYRELIGSWGLDRVDVVGHSLGAMFAAEIAAVCPQLVRRLVLVDAFGLWTEDPAVDPFGAPEEVRRAKWHGEPPDPEPTNHVPDPDDPQGAAIFTAKNLATATKFLWPIADRGLRRRLPHISAPTLVVHGESDGLVPLGHAREFVRLVPDAKLAVIPQAGHYPMIEREDEFVPVVEKFLSD